MIVDAEQDMAIHRMVNAYCALVLYLLMVHANPIVELMKYFSTNNVYVGMDLADLVMTYVRTALH